MGWFWIAGIILAVISAYIYNGRRHKRLLPESLFIVSFDSVGISVTDPSGESRRVLWNRLTKVGIRTTGDGPFSPDVFWDIYSGSDEPSIVFPGGASGEAELLRELQRRLSGFDNERLIEAMGSTSDAFFVLWKRSGSELTGHGAGPSASQPC